MEPEYILQTVFNENCRARLTTDAEVAKRRYFEVHNKIEAFEAVDRHRLKPEEWKLYYTRAELQDLLFSIYYRQNVPFASGPQPLDQRDAWTMWRDRMIRAEWQAYLETAHHIGMFLGNKGKELLNALRSNDYAQFHAAMAECMVCWLLAGKEKLSLQPYVQTQNGKDVEFVATLASTSTELFIEVKAPYKPSPVGLFRSIGPSERIDPVVGLASKKFLPNKANVVAVVPRVDGIHDEHDARRAYFQAVYGRSSIGLEINTKTGHPGKTFHVFKRDGRFLKPRKAGMPAHTRVSALLGVRPFSRGEIPDGNAWVDHEVLIAENPFASIPLPKDFLPGVPRLTNQDEQLVWSDGWPIDA